MSIFDDYRASLAPSTAKRRLDYYSGLSATFEAKSALDAAVGRAGDDYGSPQYRLGELLAAHVGFAQAQIRDEANTGSRTATIMTSGEQTAGTIKAKAASVTADAELRLDCLKMAMAQRSSGDPREEAEALFRYVREGITKAQPRPQREREYPGAAEAARSNISTVI